MVKKRISKKIIKIVQNYTKRLTEQDKIPIEQVIIFGSQVKGKVHKWSDVDVCIISPKFKDPIRAIAFLLMKRKLKEVMAGLEPVGFTKKDFKSGGSFIGEIKKTGLELKIKT